MAATDFQGLTAAVKDKNRTILQVRNIVAAGLMAVIGLGYWYHHDDTHRINGFAAISAQQRSTIERQANQSKANQALYCAQGTFLSQIIHTSVSTPSPNTSPATIAAVQKELSSLDTALAANCHQ